ncbi:MAG: PaaI family thioesterase [Alphaproteobacteria bacterium]
MTTAPAMAPAAGFASALGMMTRLAGAGPEGADLLRFETGATHDDGRGMVHGGVLMTFAHVLLGTCLYPDPAAPAPGSLSVTCEFLAEAPAGAVLEGAARITRRTRSIIFLAGDIVEAGPDPARPLMTATGLWRVAAGRPTAG